MLVIVAAFLVPALAFVGIRAISLAGEGPGSCNGDDTIRVATAPELVRPMKVIAENIEDSEASVGDKCLAVRVLSVRPFDMYEILSDGNGKAQADLWIPDSLHWVQRAGIPDERVIPLRSSVAASPVVVAATSDLAGKVEDDAETWESLARASDLAISDPEQSGLALSALLAIRRSIAGGGAEDDSDAQANRNRMAGAVRELLDNQVYDLAEELNAANEPSGLRSGVPATEQQLIGYEKRHPDADVDPILPEQGTVLLDYPLVAVAHGKQDTDRLIDAGAALMRHVEHSAGQDALRSEGFRSLPELSSINGPVDVGGVPMLHESMPGDGEEALRSWAAVGTSSKLLAVLDLSSSMEEPVEGDDRRVELTGAAVSNALSYLPDTSAVGLWGFSSQRAGELDYESLVEMSTLSEDQRSALNGALDGLADEVGGGTGRFDTMLAAYRTMVTEYNSSRQNALIMVTDGADDHSAISQTTLLQQLRSLTNSDRPVETILIGVGSDVNIAELEQMAQVTGGRALHATTPEKLERLVLDSMLVR